MHKGEVVKDIQTSPETLKELELFFCGLNIKWQPQTLIINFFCSV
jgi:hypothetical protein